MEIGYYPGCALHGSSNDYETSVRACLAALGVGLRELDDWICCGATAAHSLNHKLAVALPARNLAIAERDGLTELLAPCPMCSMELLKASRRLGRLAPSLRQEISEIVELDVDGGTQVLNLIQVLQKVGLEADQAEGRPAAGRVPPGLLLRLPADAAAARRCSSTTASSPARWKRSCAALGAEPVEWNYKTECCGAGMTMADEDDVLELSHKILSNAAAHGANCIVVACPMCHVNLDMKQADIERRYGVPPRPGRVLPFRPGRPGLGPRRARRWASIGILW